MTFLTNKKILIFGIKNNFSIAYGIALSMYQQNANLAFVYHNKKSKKNIAQLASQVRSKIILYCDINSDNSINHLFKHLSELWGTFDGIVHSIAYTPTLQLHHDYLDIINRKDFLNAHETNSFSLVALVKAAKDFLNQNSSIVTISYIGAIKYVPYYNIMGIVKASLESNVRYLAFSMGKKKIRVNAISAGAIKTTSSYGIKSFYKILVSDKKKSPLNKTITSQEIGNVAAFLCSNLSSGITGQVIFVDAGINIA
ncbi:enoyl-ACP reductase FabI [Buchnera aphidicola]|uniref:enoyl-ACP reductase FabI n=1 Tax=Buchnera aphidicola TaxID=9 RepID=UPI00094C7AB1|nr:enoyl-ACP reductase [Buchnera aphidicola]